MIFRNSFLIYNTFWNDYFRINFLRDEKYEGAISNNGSAGRKSLTKVYAVHKK